MSMTIAVMLVFIVQALVTLFLLERQLTRHTSRARISWWQHWLVGFVSFLPLSIVAVLDSTPQGTPLLVEVTVAVLIAALGTTVGVYQFWARRRGRSAA